ncbi:MAG: hypothetical protein AVO35_11805 [Candidatus Aegiribacteria sp. MLS_C]|nr:MAG: hypothetical protein AVO35_11805 [Candidatus Aegiribacteria sp. MLS_C]
MMRLAPLILFIPALATGASVVNSFDAPDTGISALAWDGTGLWAVDGTTQYVYQLDPSDGTVLSSFYIVDNTTAYDPVPGGATFLNGTLYVAMHYSTNYGKVYKYDTGGGYLGEFDVYC